jgi:hypothetical protein
MQNGSISHPHKICEMLHNAIVGQYSAQDSQPRASESDQECRATTLPLNGIILA